MSFSQFLSTLTNGFTIFYNGLTSLSNVLIENYIVIVLLGLPLFLSVLYFLFDLLFDLPFHKTKNLDDIGGE